MNANYFQYTLIKELKIEIISIYVLFVILEVALKLRMKVHLFFNCYYYFVIIIIIIIII